MYTAVASSFLSKRIPESRCYQVVLRLAKDGCSLLLIDAVERYDPTDLSAMETPELVNLYTLCSDVQRSANDLHQEVRSILLDRPHHDNPIHGQYGSVQRTSRRNRTLKDDETALDKLENEGIDRERVTTVDASKVDDALNVTELSESDLYDIEESQYVRKADVDEQRKESRLQGLKISSLLPILPKLSSSNAKSEISKLVSTSSPASALQVRSTETRLNKSGEQQTDRDRKP